MSNYVLNLKLDTKGYDEFLEKRFRIAHRLKNKTIEWFNRQEYKRQNSDEYKLLSKLTMLNIALEARLKEEKDKNRKAEIKSVQKALSERLKKEWIDLNNSFGLDSGKFPKVKILGQASNMYSNYLKKGLIMNCNFESIVSDVKGGYLKRRANGRNSSNRLNFVKYENFRSLYFRKCNQNISMDGISFGRGKSRFTLPFKFKPNDEVRLSYALEYQDIALYQIIRERDKHGKWIYSVSIVFDGIPYNAHRTESTGKVGIDMGVSSITAVNSSGDIKWWDLRVPISMIESIEELDKKIEARRRFLNPDNYNDDGTNKRGRLKWNFDDRYYKLLGKKRHLQHKIKKRRDSLFGSICNQILKMGDEFIIEDMDYKKLQEKKPLEKNEDGSFKSRKNFGKSLLYSAPSSFMLKLSQKLGYIEKELVKVNTYDTKITQFDHLTGERHKLELENRWKMLGGKTLVQRNFYNAFLLSNYDYELKNISDNVSQEQFKNFIFNQNVLLKKLRGSDSLSLGLMFKEEFERKFQ